MKCPRCGYNYCDIVSETKTTGKDYSICGGLLGEALLGPAGFMCGFSDSRNMDVDICWKCKKCGFMFKD